MGECGCASNWGHYKLRAPDGWYVISLYAGCKECDTAAGVQVDWLSEAGAHVISSLDRIMDCTDILRQSGAVGFPIFDFHQLVKFCAETRTMIRANMNRSRI